MNDDESPEDVIAALRAREPIFHRPELGTTQEAFAAMVVDGYWEIGASGRIYDRKHVLAVLENRHSRPVQETWTVDDLTVRPLGPDVHLCTYTLHKDGRVTRRATVWSHEDGTWRALYHQGTPAPGAPSGS